MRILIADDDLGVRRTLERLLRSKGYDVASVASGRQAWDFQQGPNPADLLLLDWFMPQETGLDCCRRLRSDAHQRPCYIIIITGRVDSNATVEALHAGADDIVSKPWDRDELMARVRAGERQLQAQKGVPSGVRAALDEALECGEGEVVVRDGDTVGRIYVHQGRIAWVALSSADDDFFGALRSRVAIEPSDWEALVQDCRVRRGNILSAISEWGFASEAAIEELLRDFVQSRLEQIAALRGATALFLREQRHYLSSDHILFELDDFPNLFSQRSAGAIKTVPPPSLGTPAPVHIEERLQRELATLMHLPGAEAAALIDMNSSETVWASEGISPGIEANARMQCRALRSLGNADEATEIISLCNGSWHILIRVPGELDWSLYLAVDGESTNLARARFTMRKLTKALHPPTSD